MPQGKPEVAAQEYRRLILHFPMRLTFNKALLQGGALQCIASCKFQASLNSTFPFYCVKLCTDIGTCMTVILLFLNTIQ